VAALTPNRTHPNPSPSALGEGLSSSSQAVLPSPRSEGRRLGDEGRSWEQGLEMRSLVGRTAGDEESSANIQPVKSHRVAAEDIGPLFGREGR
jgi:hypothetical protein